MNLGIGDCGTAGGVFANPGRLGGAALGTLGKPGFMGLFESGPGALGGNLNSA
jgi:hypothetical protein